MPFPIDSRNGAIPRANAGSPSEDEAFVSILRLRFQEVCGSQLPRLQDEHRALNSFRGPIDEGDVLDLFSEKIENRTDASFDPIANLVAPRRTRRLGNIILSSGPDPSPDQRAIERALVEGVRDHGLSLLPWNERALQLRQRARFAHDFDHSIPALDDRSLIERLEEWLTPLTADKRALSDIAPVALTSALEQLFSYDARRNLDRLAPVEFLSPAGSTHLIDYCAVAGPTVAVRAQALFGLSSHPMIAGGAVALVLAITSPAGRPIQTTKDLSGFWSGSWKDVAKEMRGRYPKHSWPDDPSSAHPTLRSKRASGSF